LPGLGSGMILHAYCSPVSRCVANRTLEKPAAAAPRWLTDGHVAAAGAMHSARKQAGRPGQHACSVGAAARRFCVCVRSHLPPQSAPPAHKPPPGWHPYAASSHPCSQAQGRLGQQCSRHSLRPASPAPATCGSAGSLPSARRTQAPSRPRRRTLGTAPPQQLCAGWECSTHSPWAVHTLTHAIVAQPSASPPARPGSPGAVLRRFQRQWRGGAQGGGPSERCRRLMVSAHLGLRLYR
jgi:hypothetical protein